MEVSIPIAGGAALISCRMEVSIPIAGGAALISCRMEVSIPIAGGAALISCRMEVSIPIHRVYLGRQLVSDKHPGIFQIMIEPSQPYFVTAKNTKLWINDYMAESRVRQRLNKAKKRAL